MEKYKTKYVSFVPLQWREMFEGGYAARCLFYGKQFPPIQDDKN